MEIEAVVTGHPDVVEAAVVGVPDDTKGTVPIAFVTLRTMPATTPRSRSGPSSSARWAVTRGWRRSTRRRRCRRRAPARPCAGCCATSSCTVARRATSPRWGPGRPGGRRGGGARMSPPRAFLLPRRRSGEQGDGPVVRGAPGRHGGRARDHPHGHRDRQRSVHDDDDEPAAAAPRRGVRGRHRVREAAGELHVHRRAGRRAGGTGADAGHHDREPGLLGHRVPEAGVRGRHDSRGHRGDAGAAVVVAARRRDRHVPARGDQPASEVVCRATRAAFMRCRPAAEAPAGSGA
jgi:hypothetical protein